MTRKEKYSVYMCHACARSKNYPCIAIVMAHNAVEPSSCVYGIRDKCSWALASEFSGLTLKDIETLLVTLAL